MLASAAGMTLRSEMTMELRVPKYPSEQKVPETRDFEVAFQDDGRADRPGTVRDLMGPVRSRSKSLGSGMKTKLTDP